MGDGARPVIFASLLLDCRVFIYIYFAAESTLRRKYRTAAFFAFSPHKKHYHPVYIRLYYNNSITQLSSVLGKKHKKARRFWLFCAKRGNKAPGARAGVCADAGASASRRGGYQPPAPRAARQYVQIAAGDLFLHYSLFTANARRSPGGIPRRRVRGSSE